MRMWRRGAVSICVNDPFEGYMTIKLYLEKRESGLTRTVWCTLPKRPDIEEQDHSTELYIVVTLKRHSLGKGWVS